MTRPKSFFIYVWCGTPWKNQASESGAEVRREGVTRASLTVLKFVKIRRCRSAEGPAHVSASSESGRLFGLALIPRLPRIRVATEHSSCSARSLLPPLHYPIYPC